MASKTWAQFNIYFVEEHQAWQDTQPTSSGATYLSENALVEVNSREAETIDAISLLAYATASNRDTYANLS